MTQDRDALAKLAEIPPAGSEELKRLSARFEAKREECERAIRDNQCAGDLAEARLQSRMRAFTEARDMAREATAPPAPAQEGLSPTPDPVTAARAVIEIMPGEDTEDERTNALKNCAEAIAFFDQVRSASSAEQAAVGTDHWNWLEQACRRAAALATLHAHQENDGETAE